uniref:Uncharacterized protein n=1 Tax=Cucumis melo TaxID=3656 RepID=A0A9I9EHH8_CUCME
MNLKELGKLEIKDEGVGVKGFRERNEILFKGFNYSYRVENTIFDEGLKQTIFDPISTKSSVESMVRRNKRVFGSSSRPIKSNKDDFIVINDADVNYMMKTNKYYFSDSEERCDDDPIDCPSLASVFLGDENYGLTGLYGK